MDFRYYTGAFNNSSMNGRRSRIGNRDVFELFNNLINNTTNSFLNTARREDVINNLYEQVQQLSEEEKTRLYIYYNYHIYYFINSPYNR